MNSTHDHQADTPSDRCRQTSGDQAHNRGVCNSQQQHNGRRSSRPRCHRARRLAARLGRIDCRAGVSILSWWRLNQEQGRPGRRGRTPPAWSDDQIEPMGWPRRRLRRTDRERDQLSINVSIAGLDRTAGLSTLAHLHSQYLGWWTEGKAAIRRPRNALRAVGRTRHSGPFPQAPSRGHRWRSGNWRQ